MALPGTMGDQEEIHLRDYLRVIRKHRWIILTLFIVVATTVTIGTLLQTPIYEASVRVLIDREPPRVLNVQEVQAPLDTTAQDYYQTQYEMIKSRAIIEKVIENLNLKKRIPGLENAPDPVMSLLGVVHVEPKRNTRLVDIKVDDPDPKLAADIANAIGNAYTRYNLELRLRGTKDASTWLSEQLSELKAKVQDSEAALQKYREKSGIIGIEQQRNIISAEIIDLNKSYLDAQAQRLGIEVRLRELNSLMKGGPTSPQGAILLADNPLLQKLKAEESDLEVQLSKTLKVYREKHPEVQKIRSQIDQVHERMKQEVQVVINSVSAEYKVAKAREDSLLQRLNDSRKKALDLNEKEIQYMALQRETNSNQQLYDMLLKRLKETGVSGGLETTNVHVVEEATVPSFPVKPKKKQNIILGVLFGLMLGVGVAFTLEYFDNTIKTPEEVERYLGLPTLGIIPVIGGRPR